MFLLLNNIKNKAMVGKTQNILNCTITLLLRRPPAKSCLIAKTTGAAWRTVSSMYQITRSERDIFCAAVSRTFKFYIVASL